MGGYVFIQALFHRRVALCSCLHPQGDPLFFQAHPLGMYHVSTFAHSRKGGRTLCVVLPHVGMCLVLALAHGRLRKNRACP